MCKQLGEDELKLQCEVLSLSYNQKGIPALGNWSVSSMSKNTSEDQSYDAVVVTVSFLFTFVSEHSIPFTAIELAIMFQFETYGFVRECF